MKLLTVYSLQLNYKKVYYTTNINKFETKIHSHWEQIVII